MDCNLKIVKKLPNGHFKLICKDCKKDLISPYPPKLTHRQCFGSTGIIAKVWRFADAHKKWVNAGKPLRSAEEISKIYYEQCAKCPEIDHNTCSLCGCKLKPKGNTLNKIAWATEECPLKKWLPTVDVEEEEKKEPAEQAQTSLPVHRKANGKTIRKRGCCGG